MQEIQIERCIQQFRDYLKYEKRYSDHTVLAYIKDIHQFFSFLNLIEDSRSVAAVHYKHVRSWIVSLSEDDVCNRSINRKISSLRSFYKFLRKSNNAIINPTDRVSALKLPKRLPSVIREKELMGIFDVIFTGEESYFQWRDFAIIELLYNTGIRRAELIQLSTDDLLPGHNQIKVVGKGRKERIIPLNTSISQTFAKYMRWRNNLENVESNSLFLSDGYKEIYPKAVYNIVRKYLSLITTAEKKSPHVLRHSFATHLTDRGAELNAVKDLLGHASLAATQVYTHNSIEQLKDIYHKTHPKG